MSSEEIVRVQVESGDLRHTVEGNVDEVIREVIEFVSKIVPTYNLASRILYVPEYQSIVSDLSSLVNLTKDGQILLLNPSLSATQAIRAILLAAHIANKVGNRPSDEVTIEEMVRSSGRASKTVRNTIAQISRNGSIERAGRAAYRIRAIGVKRFHEFLRSQIQTASQAGGLETQEPS